MWINKAKKLSKIGQDPKKFEICFCVIFNHYYKIFISTKETGYLALFLFNFEVSLKFTNFLRS